MEKRGGDPSSALLAPGYQRTKKGGGDPSSALLAPGYQGTATSLPTGRQRPHVARLRSPCDSYRQVHNLHICISLGDARRVWPPSTLSTTKTANETRWPLCTRHCGDCLILTPGDSGSGKFVFPGTQSPLHLLTPRAQCGGVGVLSGWVHRLGEQQAALARQPLVLPLDKMRLFQLPAQLCTTLTWALAEACWERMSRAVDTTPCDTHPATTAFQGKASLQSQKQAASTPAVLQQVLTSLSALGPADGHMVHPSVTLQGGGGGRG